MERNGERIIVATHGNDFDGLPPRPFVFETGHGLRALARAAASSVAEPARAPARAVHQRRPGPRGDPQESHYLQNEGVGPLSAPLRGCKWTQLLATG